MSILDIFKKSPAEPEKENRAMNLTLNDIDELRDLLGGNKNPSGKVVNEETAIKSSAVFACIRLIAGAIAGLPLQVFDTKNNNKEPSSTHPLAPILSLRPNPITTAYVFWESVLYNLLLTGNAYALIGRTGGGGVASITNLPAQLVEPKNKDGRLIYKVALGDGKYAVYDQDDILHIPGLGFNGVKGLSVLGAAGVSIGANLAQDEYSARFFSNGARPDGVISFDKQVTKEQAELIRDYWYNKHRGVENSHLPAVLSEGGKYEQTSLSAQDSQLIESRKFQITDIARIFGVPPHMIGETEKSTAWGSGLEQQVTGFVMFTLRPHIKRAEQEIQRKLIRNNRFYSKFNLSGLLRGDVKTRHEAYRSGIGGNQIPGYMTVNEVRKLENLPSIEGGDELYKPITGAIDENTKPTD